MARFIKAQKPSSRAIFSSWFTSTGRMKRKPGRNRLVTWFKSCHIFTIMCQIQPTTARSAFSSQPPWPSWNRQAFLVPLQRTRGNDNPLCSLLPSMFSNSRVSSPSRVQLDIWRYKSCLLISLTLVRPGKVPTCVVIKGLKIRSYRFVPFTHGVSES